MIDAETRKPLRVVPVDEEGLPTPVGIGHLLGKFTPAPPVANPAPPDDPSIRKMFNIEFEDW